MEDDVIVQAVCTYAMYYDGRWHGKFVRGLDFGDRAEPCIKATVTVEGCRDGCAVPQPFHVGRTYLVTFEELPAT